jgi:hypothetical protein
MTITLTREEAQQVLDALEGVKDMAWDSDTVAGRKLIETLRARLAQPELMQVSPKEFIAAVTGKWDIQGIPMVMSVWPTKEATGEQQ